MQSAQTIPVRSAPLQFPQPVRDVEVIPQTELQLLLSLRGRLKQLQNKSRPRKSPSKTGSKPAPSSNRAITRHS
jgi:hypothetical protein